MTLQEIQRTLKAPKGQINRAMGYRYRSCEDILEAVKPLLDKCMLTITDEMVEIGGRVYVKATARIKCDKEVTEVSAYAREAETKKWLDDSQITGAASSYARKYALNGLFLIDDTRDADTQESPKEQEPVVNVEELRAAMQQLKTREELKLLWKELNTATRKDKEVVAAFAKYGKTLAI